MNPLLKSLIDEATVRNYRGLGKIDAHVDPEKLCQLIIEHLCTEFDEVSCADHCMDDWDNGYDAGLMQASSSARELFGVK